MESYGVFVFMVLCFPISTFGLGENTLKGRKEVEIKSILSSLFDDYNQPYSPMFSPPPEENSLNSNISNSTQPTVVHLSVENFRVLGYLYQSGELVFAADIVAEYVDKRLAYKAPEGLKYVDVQAYGGHSVWSPSLTFPRAPISNAVGPDIWIDDDSKYIPKVLVGPQGQVYRKFGVYRQLRAAEEKEKDDYETGYGRRIRFNLEIAEERNPIENVQLRWKNTTSPMRFADYRVQQRTGEKAHLNVISGTTPCSRGENLGGFGREEFSCVQVSFTYGIPDGTYKGKD